MPRGPCPPPKKNPPANKPYCNVYSLAAWGQEGRMLLLLVGTLLRHFKEHFLESLLFISAEKSLTWMSPHPLVVSPRSGSALF